MKKIFPVFIIAMALIAYQSCKKEDKKEEEVVVETIEYKTFDKERIAFGGDHKQTVAKTFTMHPQEKNIDKIKMFVHLDCPAGGCNIWDVYANIKVKNQETDEWMEIGRYITPYGVDTKPVPRGLEIDVTDFKSLLHGEVELRALDEIDYGWGRVDVGY